MLKTFKTKTEAKKEFKKGEGLSYTENGSYPCLPCIINGKLSIVAEDPQFEEDAIVGVIENAFQSILNLFGDECKETGVTLAETTKDLATSVLTTFIDFVYIRETY